MNVAVLFVLNSDMYTEFFYQTGFQRYRVMFKVALYMLKRQAETFL